jgi:flotillin
VLINVNITDITDESGYIEAIGRKAASQAVQQARVDVAEQEKRGQIGVAEAEREKAISGRQRHQAPRDRHPRAEREQAVRFAELDKDRDRARSASRTGSLRSRGPHQGTPSARCAYRRGRRAKRAQAIGGEATGDRRPRSPTRRPAAGQAGRGLPDRRNQEARGRGRGAGSQNRAMAKAGAGEAERSRPSAGRARSPRQGPEGQDHRRGRGRGRKAASSRPRPRPAIFAKLEAEARGQYEILAKKGEGLQKIIDACGGAQQAFQLLMLEHLDNLAETRPRPSPTSSSTR